MTIPATRGAAQPSQDELLLDAMVSCLARGNSIYLPSAFWEAHNQKNFKQIEAEGIENIKQTVAQNYFTWVIGSENEQFQYLKKHTRFWDGFSIKNGAAKFDQDSRLTHNQQYEMTLFTRMLWKFAAQLDELKLLKSIEEPLEGNPFRIHLGGKLISQDLANSVLEFYSIREQFRPPLNEAVRICELGAGYGRNAYVFLRAFPNCKYVVIDIPPALYVSQHYLKSVFPDRKVFQFRCFDEFAEVEDELMASDIAFLLPHQAELLPAGSADLFLNISSLHEMTMEQIRAYFGLVDRLTNGYFYSKQWFVSENDHDRIRIRHDDYPVPDHWRQRYLRPAKVQTSFFEALYEINGSAAAKSLAEGRDA